MDRYEYKVVPAPNKAPKIKGLRGTDQKFASALAALMNQYGAEGWEYQRTDTLPVEERTGLTGKTTTFQNMLIFRKKIEGVPVEEAAAPAQIEHSPDPVDQTPEETAEPVQALPSFRPAAAAAPALAATAEAPEGSAPSIGAATAPEPSTSAPEVNRPAH